MLSRNKIQEDSIFKYFFKLPIEEDMCFSKNCQPEKLDACQIFIEEIN